MPYSSSLKYREWEILEPVLHQALPPKKKTRPPEWNSRERLDGMPYQLKSDCNWGDLPKDFPPYSTVYWHYKQWRDAGVFGPIARGIAWAVAGQGQNKSVDHLNHD